MQVRVQSGKVIEYFFLRSKKKGAHRGRQRVPCSRWPREKWVEVEVDEVEAVGVEVWPRREKCRRAYGRTGVIRGVVENPAQVKASGLRRLSADY